MVHEIFEREALIIGKAALEKLKNTAVLVFGVGGVGSYAVEGLVRAGVGKIIAVDNDTVSASNINRQLIADTTTLGRYKSEASRERSLKINPDLTFLCDNSFVTSENAKEIIKKYSPDFIVDAIDNVSAKLAIITYAKEHDIDIISSMGTGNKLYPERLELCDIYKTSVCPLARVMRRELKSRGVKSLTVLYSDEKPLKNSEGATPIIKDGTRNAPGSISFVPSVGGLLISAGVVRKIIGKEQK